MMRYQLTRKAVGESGHDLFEVKPQHLPEADEENQDRSQPE
jgi:hypothetical protein